MSISKEDQNNERRTRHCRKPQRCVYYAIGSNDGYNGTCDYILITGHRRPCGFGAACTVKETQGRKDAQRRDEPRGGSESKAAVRPGLFGPVHCSGGGCDQNYHPLLASAERAAAQRQRRTTQEGPDCRSKEKGRPRAGTSKDGK
ncbi:MAG: hypothetical protein ACLUNZ_13695 [Evtepia sp.]